MTTLTISNDQVILSCEFGYATDIDDIIDNFCLLMEGAGWHRDTIYDAIVRKSDEINDRTTDTVKED